MRKVHWGTPSRSGHYLTPRRTSGLVLAGLAAGGGILALLLIGDVAGLRSPVSPAHVTSRHMIYDTRCEECHVAFDGASDVRCQRCHDPAAAGRLTNPAHVFFGSLDAAKAGAAPAVTCATCHVEHRGVDALLTAVDEAQCTGCHADASQFETAFSTLGAHTEFDVLAQKQRQRAGITFNHLSHTTGVGDKIGYVLKDRGLTAPAQTCGECHRLAMGEKDFEPIRFDRHCNSCHGVDLKMDPVPAVDVDAYSDLEFNLDEATMRRWNMRASDFEDDGGEVLKVVVAHKDPWFEHNRLKLWRALDPAAFAAARAQLAARQGRLERRLAQASPTALEGEDELQQRTATLEAEIEYLDERLAAQQGAEAPAAALGRLDEALAAVVAAGGSQEPASELVRRGAALRTQGIPEAPLTRAQLDERRAQLLSVLDAIEKANPERSTQVADLRRRLELLTPGETSPALLQRARAQRVETLRRLHDELELRRSGTAPPSETLLGTERQAIAAALGEVKLALAEYDRIAEPEGTLPPATIERKQKSVAALMKGCTKCHQLSPLGALSEVKAAEPVLWRATFSHREHLTQGEACTSCHAGGEGEAAWSIETSRSSQDLNFKGIDSCRECHNASKASDACLECHKYHPPARP